MQETGSQRIYGGLSAAERTAARRVRWLEAGLEVFGTLGWRGATLRGVARVSGVAERYFSESFPDLADLLVAVDAHIHEGLEERVVTALREAHSNGGDMLRAALTAMIEYLREDPRRARVKFVESVFVAQETEAQGRRSMDLLGKLLIGTSALNEHGLPTGVTPAVIGVALSGAVVELMLAVFRADDPLPPQTFVDAAVTVVRRAARAT